MAEEKNYEEKFNELNSEMEKVQADLKSSEEALEEKEKELAEVKSQMETKEADMAVEAKSQTDSIEEIKKELTEVKSVIEKIRETPVNKTAVEAKSESIQTEVEMNPLSYV